MNSIKKIFILVLGIIKSFKKRFSLFFDNLLGRIKKAKIVVAGYKGQKVFVFKEKTIEKIEISKVYGFVKDGSFIIEYPEIDLWKFKGATVVGRTDYVLLESGEVFWKKYFEYNYSKNIPSDRLFVKEQQGVLYYRKPRKTINVDCAFSLLGVHAQIWSHALSEYFPKISVLDKVINDSSKKVTVLVPNYNDTQLKTIIYNELNKYQGVEILAVEDEVAVKVNNLYYMERPATFTDHEVSVAIGDNVQPSMIADILKDRLVNPLISGLNVNSKYRKLYLPRHGRSRNLTNYKEIEELLKKEGFYFLEEPHKLSLEEKIEIYYSADIIVGPYGSAFSNIIFSRPGTKVLIFSNYNRVFESWLCFHQQHFGINTLWVTGFDDKNASNPSHCSYYIPKDKIIAASKELGILNE